MGEANEIAAGNQKKETLTVIPPRLIENQRVNTGKSLFTRELEDEKCNKYIFQKL